MCVCKCVFIGEFGLGGGSTRWAHACTGIHVHNPKKPQNGYLTHLPKSTRFVTVGSSPAGQSRSMSWNTDTARLPTNPRWMGEAVPSESVYKSRHLPFTWRLVVGGCCGRVWVNDGMVKYQHHQYQ